METAWLRTLYVVFWSELGSRRLYLAGVTANPDCRWMSQQARNLAIKEQSGKVGYLIHDRDAKFCAPFDQILRSEAVKIVKTPVRAPRANAFAERFVRTARAECLDWLLILGRAIWSACSVATSCITTASGRTARSLSPLPLAQFRRGPGHRRRRSGAATSSAA